MPGKLVIFDDDMWAAIDLLAKDRMMTFQEAADEAFRDYLRKFDRPVGTKESLRKSVGRMPANDTDEPAPKPRKKSPANGKH